MALDESVLNHAIARHEAKPLVRLYSWVPPALTVGATLQLPEDSRQRCDDEGVAVVKRATGGGCVLHDGDLTYSVVAPQDGRGVLEAYRWVARGLIAGFGVLGVEAEVAEHPTRGRPLDCFQSATGADLEVQGSKICGSAQVRREGWFLQHGSIPFPDVRERTARLLGGSVDRSSTCLDRVRPGTTWEELAEALVAGFSAAWGTPPELADPVALHDPLGMV